MVILLPGLAWWSYYYLALPGGHITTWSCLVDHITTWPCPVDHITTWPGLVDQFTTWPGLLDHISTWPCLVDHITTWPGRRSAVASRGLAGEVRAGHDYVAGRVQILFGCRFHQESHAVPEK